MYRFEYRLKNSCTDCRTDVDKDIFEDTRSITEPAGALAVRHTIDPWETSIRRKPRCLLRTGYEAYCLITLLVQSKQPGYYNATCEGFS